MEQRRRLHPHKFTLWVGIASIVMMFAGLTSAYIVKRNQANWISFELPAMFWYSTVIILFSSLTLHLSDIALKQWEMPRYRVLVIITRLLGIAFVVTQVMGFQQLWLRNYLTKNVSFFVCNCYSHALHVIGGIVAPAVLFVKAFSSKVRNYNIVPLEVISTYCIL
jgi:cytochrome c oxidase subunit 3